MDQLNGFQIEGIKLWGPMIKDYETAGLTDKLIYGKSDKENTISSPELSEYVRPYQVASTGLYYNGLNFCQAHYLSPIAETTSTSPIYQNPGWPIKANESADR